jgi:DNA-binding response OmpR family regulator
VTLLQHMCPHCGYNLMRDSPITINEYTCMGPSSPLFLLDRRLDLTQREAEVCYILMRSYPGAVSYDSLLNRTGSSGTSSTINVVVCKIRAKFSAWDLRCPIDTIKSVGLIWRP